LCDPLDTDYISGSCLKAGSQYLLQVIANNGASTFTGDLLMASPTDPTFFVDTLSINAITSSSFTITWTASPSTQPVSGYRIWANIASDHNGYDASKNKTLVYSIELRPEGLSARSTVLNSIYTYTFSGCYEASDMLEHCIEPWTLYEINVAPYNAALDGTPRVVIVLTSERASPAPANLSVVIHVPFDWHFITSFADCSHIVQHQSCLEAPISHRSSCFV
jgi:hypothetical protein